MSLLELLVVLAIIAIMAVAVIPAANSVIRGYRLSQAVDQLESGLNLARHAAISSNHTVEVRFYQAGDPNIPGQQMNNPSACQFRGFQLFLYNSNGNAVALDKVEQLPLGIIIDSGTYSSLISSSGSPPVKTFNPPLDPQSAIPAAGTAYNVRAFQFRPDGSTNLAVGAQWCLTLHVYVNGSPVYSDPLPTTPPNPPTIDFATIQIDPIAGGLTIFRR